MNKNGKFLCGMTDYPSGTVNMEYFLKKKPLMPLLETCLQLTPSWRLPTEVSHLKKLIKLHQGLALKRKVKLIDEQLNNYNKR